MITKVNVYNAILILFTILCFVLSAFIDGYEQKIKMLALTMFIMIKGVLVKWTYFTKVE